MQTMSLSLKVDWNGICQAESVMAINFSVWNGDKPVIIIRLWDSCNHTALAINVWIVADCGIKHGTTWHHIKHSSVTVLHFLQLCAHPQCLQSPWRTGILPGSCLWLSPAWLQISCSCWQTTPAAACSRSARVPAPSEDTIGVRGEHMAPRVTCLTLYYGALSFVLLTSLSVKWDLSFSCSGVKYKVFSSDNGQEMEIIAQHARTTVILLMQSVTSVALVPFSAPLLSAPCTRKI